MSVYYIPRFQTYMMSTCLEKLDRAASVKNDEGGTRNEDYAVLDLVHEGINPRR